MDLISFAITVIILTASGALAPGPLFLVTITQGLESGTKSGIIFSIAHTIIEFTLVMLLALGFLNVASEPAVRFAVGIAGGAALIVFGVMQIQSSFNKTNETKTEKTASRNLFVIGMALTGLNPYFIIWWLTIGANLIILALEFLGLGGVIFMYICHVWIDYVWLTLVSGFAKKSAKFLHHKLYRLMIAVFGIVLIFFGLSFLINALFI